MSRFTYIFPTHNFSLCTKGFESCISGISVSFDKEFLFNAPITLKKIIKISICFLNVPETKENPQTLLQTLSIGTTFCRRNSTCESCSLKSLPRSLSHLYNRFSINKSVMKGCDTSTKTAPIICDSLD